MENPTTGRHRRPCHSMAGRVWALTAALLATALAAIFSPRLDRPSQVPRALPAAPTPGGNPGHGRRGSDLLAEPPGFPAQNIWAAGASTASTLWEQAYRDRPTLFEPEDAVDADPDQIAGALVRPYLGPAMIPRPRPAEPSDYPARPSTVEPEPVKDEFAELADRIRTYLAMRN
ncbi:hypothetical protein ACOQFV_02235 [Nocardiopsis changdeensis]|uniref:Uncharacterized protein n=1 Tax=Nocardiopsis changdeensis TaxID=2831969 RepID=A0ABX8BNZ8_9ACTN|nr:MULTISPECIES: hypothetical protein [Nocardiopsis]QUX22468.1 hypothetical protein KGD84_29820 [Nocardiopsis changdeensis]QYX38410.1 hypothetical protein K1J57_07200 [Nocardiopsis sp. MT53]